MAFSGHALARPIMTCSYSSRRRPSFSGPGILVPSRIVGLFRWCLEMGLRVVQPMTLMTVGLYNEPVGAYLPSVLY